MLLDEAIAYLDGVRWDFEDVIRRPSPQGSVMLHFRTGADAVKSLDDWRALADACGGLVGLTAILLVAAVDDLTITTSALVEGVEDVDGEQRALQVLRNYQLRVVRAGEGGEGVGDGVLDSSGRLRVGDGALGDVLAKLQGHKVLAYWTRGNVMMLLWDLGQILEVVYDEWGGDGYEIGVYGDLQRVMGAATADWLVMLEDGGVDITPIVS